MDGNFRIIQESDFVFIIQRERIRTSTTGRILKKTIKISEWFDVDLKGNYSTIINPRMWYITIDKAIKALNDIKKFPLIVYPETKAELQKEE